MTDPREFERRLFLWLDGELPAAEAAEMEAWCREHPEARARADAERALEGRIRQALLSDAAGGDLVRAALEKARAAGDPTRAGASSTPPRGRRLAFPSWKSGVAAAAGLLVGAMWFNCIPPFECSYLQAMESAATAPADGTEPFEGAPRETVPVALNGGVRVMRSSVAVGGSDAALLFCPTPDHEPSFRRRRTIGGADWWIGTEHGRTVVAFPDPRCRGTWCFVGAQDEATLLGAAQDLRGKLATAPK